MKARRLFPLPALLALAIGSVLLVTSCPAPGRGTTGSLRISLADGVSRTLLPTLSMSPASYLAEGSGPGGAAFSRTLAGSSSATIDALLFGTWTVTVTALNADGTAIGAGAGTATVHTNQTTNLSITVVPYDGSGTLSLGLSWPPADVETAQVQSTLLPTAGLARTLVFQVNAAAGTASSSATDIPTGYHTLTVKLLDNGVLVMGAVEVVRIVKDQTTSGTFAFANVNKPGGTLQVNITPQMAEPLTVSITGGSASKPANQALPLTATVAETGVNASCVWYVNGTATATGNGFVFDSSWPAGDYRIDVTAFSADGTRAGSATTSVQVTGTAGYHVSYDANGASSGTAPVDGVAHTVGSAVPVADNTGSLLNTGFSFAGWTTNPNPTGASASFAAGSSLTMPAGDVTLYAVWIPSNLTFTSSGTRIAITFYRTAPAGRLVIPPGVTELGDGAFQNAFSLTEVAIPSSVVTVGGETFGYTGLLAVSFPASVTTIRENAFDYCTSLESIQVDPANPSYMSVNGLLFSKDGTTLVMAPGAIVTCAVPQGVTSIAPSAFHNCQSLTQVVIPASVTGIGPFAFYQTRALTSITIPEGVTSLPEGMVLGDIALTTVNLPASLTTIGYGAFQSCIVLGSLTIPANVSSIGHGAFMSCMSLATLTVLAASPPAFEAPMTNEFANTSSSLRIVVPAASVGDYRSAPGWSDVASRIEGQ